MFMGKDLSLFIARMKTIIGAVVKKARVRDGIGGIDPAPNAFILKALSADGEKQPRTGM